MLILVTKTKHAFKNSDYSRFWCRSDARNRCEVTNTNFGARGLETSLCSRSLSRATWRREKPIFHSPGVLLGLKEESIAECFRPDKTCAACEFFERLQNKKTNHLTVYWRSNFKN